MGDKQMTELKKPGGYGKVVAMLAFFNSNFKPFDFNAFPTFFYYFPLLLELDIMSGRSLMHAGSHKKLRQGGVKDFIF